MKKSPIWDSVNGFGGNGDPAVDGWTDSSRKCLADGPFAGLEASYTMSGYQPHCVTRNWNSGIMLEGPMLNWTYTPAYVAGIRAQTTYPSFHQQLESGPHGALHSAIGGDMSPATSPNGESRPC